MMTESQRTRLFIIGIIVFIAACIFIYAVRGIVAPFLIAAFLTYLISPLALKIQSYGYRRWVAVAILTFVFLVLVAALLIIFIPLLIDEIDKLRVNFPAYYKYVVNYIDIIRTKIEVTFPVIKQYNVTDIALEKLGAFLSVSAQKAPQYLINFFSVITSIGLVLMLIFFMLLSGGKTVNTIVEVTPSSYVETILSVFYEIDSVLGKFIRGQLIEAGFVGVMSFIVLSIFNVNFALIIAIVAGFANMVPYLGPFVGLSLAVVVGLVQYQSFIIVLKIVPAFLLIQFLDNNLIQPLVVGHNVDLSPVMMVFALLAGAQVFGFIGMVFAVPVAAIIKTIFFMLVNKYKNTI